jgi:hypothetical protein
LYLNQFRADAAAGSTLVVRLRTRQARCGAGGNGHLWLAAAVMLGLPVACAGLLPAFVVKAGRRLLRDADRPGWCRHQRQ